MARMSFAATSRRDNRGVFRDCERKKVAPHAGQRPQVPQRWPYSSPAALPAVGGIAIESVQSTRLKQPPRSFAEFWRHYVLAHRHPATRAFHFAGTLAAWGLLVAAILMRNPWLVVAALLLPYALADHLLVERVLARAPHPLLAVWPLLLHVPCVFLLSLD